MAGLQLEENLERLSEALVFAEPADPKSLADLHTQFETIGELAEDESSLEVARAAAAAAQILEDIILEVVDDPIASMEVVNKIVSALQEIIRDGRDPSEVEFPKGLGINDRTADPESSVEETADVDGDESPADKTPGSEPVRAFEIKDGPTATAKPLEGDLDLLGEFVTESMEHLDGADVHLLTLETDPKDDDALNAVFRAFHTIKGVSGFLALDDIGSLAHFAENLLDKARKNELELTGPAIDVTFDAIDMLKGMVQSVRVCIETGIHLQSDAGMAALANKIKAVIDGEVVEAEVSAEEVVDAAGKLVGEILVDAGAATREDVNEALLKQSRDEGPSQKLGEVLVEDGKVQSRDVAKALRLQKNAHTLKVREAVKVDADRLDLLVDTIGELVIAESMVSQSVELREISVDMTRHISQLNKITRELQEMGTSLRMVPIRPIFQKMARLARDVSKKGGKKIEFVTNGEDTELDKTVIDKIGDPLIHMVRNAVDHGIESPEDRKKAGKPEAGRVELRAYHKGGNIYIEIEDDGKGLDREAIRKKALDRGLIKEGDSLNERELAGLILMPGFSTAKKVTDVSGRGVGLDVVKRNIDILRGQVEIRTEEGRGSVFTIKLPLTLAIIDGMVVLVGEERYIIPTLSITQSLRPTFEDLSSVFQKGEMISIRGDLIPLFRLGRLFNLEKAVDEPTEALVVVVEDDGKRVGVLTDKLLGQQQIVIKSLSEKMQGINGISGGAIMPDGRVGLILDVGGLVRLAHEQVHTETVKTSVGAGA